MSKNLPARLEDVNQRWITGVVNGKVQAITRIGPCALIISPAEIPKLVLMKEWINDELAEQIKASLNQRE
jgi:hypothetical protein